MAWLLIQRQLIHDESYERILFTSNINLFLHTMFTYYWYFYLPYKIPSEIRSTFLQQLGLPKFPHRSLLAYFYILRHDICYILMFSSSSWMANCFHQESLFSLFFSTLKNDMTHAPQLQNLSLWCNLWTASFYAYSTFSY